jgi:hypothetical protein
MEEQNVQETNQRPTFLTVLCILTFIGSGLGVLFSLFGIFGIGASNSLISNYGGVAATESGMLKPVLILVFSAVSLYGAIMMWGLKKLGFYLYVAAQILIVAFGFSWIALFFAALFIVLYGLNLKHLQ